MLVLKGKRNHILLLFPIAKWIFKKAFSVCFTFSPWIVNRQNLIWICNNPINDLTNHLSLSSEACLCKSQSHRNLTYPLNYLKKYLHLLIKYSLRNKFWPVNVHLEIILSLNSFWFFGQHQRQPSTLSGAIPLLQLPVSPGQSCLGGSKLGKSGSLRVS